MSFEPSRNAGMDCTVGTEEETEQLRHFYSLPDDVLSLVLAHVPSFSERSRLGLVCRRFRTALRCPNGWATANHRPLRLPLSHVTPLLHPVHEHRFHLVKHLDLRLEDDFVTCPAPSLTPHQNQGPPTCFSAGEGHVTDRWTALLQRVSGGLESLTVRHVYPHRVDEIFMAPFNHLRALTTFRILDSLVVARHVCEILEALFIAKGSGDVGTALPQPPLACFHADRVRMTSRMDSPDGSESARDVTVVALRRHPLVRILTIAYETALSDPEWEPLANCPKTSPACATWRSLRHLHVTNVRAPPDTWRAALAALRAIHTLLLDDCSGVTDDVGAVTSIATTPVHVLRMGNRRHINCPFVLSPLSRAEHLHTLELLFSWRCRLELATKLPAVSRVVVPVLEGPFKEELLAVLVPALPKHHTIKMHWSCGWGSSTAFSTHATAPVVDPMSTQG